MEGSGSDDRGNRLPTLDQFWQEKQEEKARQEWFDKSVEYWNNAEATVDGVLGGYGRVSSADVRESKLLLKSVLNLSDMAAHGVALDCGAGIGRVSKNLLLPLFRTVDLVEVSPVQLEAARKELSKHKHAGKFINEPLQSFTPETGRYDCIWIQWVVGYLPDDDLVKFLQRCAAALKKGHGVLILKENVTRNEQYFLDSEDNNIIRTYSQFKFIFHRAGLKLIKQRYQREFPRELFPVSMYVLKKSL